MVGGVGVLCGKHYICTMKISILSRIILAMCFVVVTLSAAAQSRSRTPLYIVNGERMSEEQVRKIAPEDIVDNQLLTIDEQTIAEYGVEASNGVVLITLRYDTPARFVVDGEELNYSAYIAERVKWGVMDGVARVIISFTLAEDGSVATTDVLEASDKRLLRRIEKAMAEAPRWQPALKGGRGVSTKHLLRITLPKGYEMPREQVVRIRG